MEKEYNLKATMIVEYNIESLWAENEEDVKKLFLEMVNDSDIDPEFIESTLQIVDCYEIKSIEHGKENSKQESINRR